MAFDFVLATLIASAIVYSVSLLLGTIGELITERAGHLNLGVEGMMILGGAFGYVACVKIDQADILLLRSVEAGSTTAYGLILLLVAVLAAMLGAGLGALLYAIITVTLRANQVVTGLALTMFGIGLANSLGSTASNTSTPKPVQELFLFRPFELLDPQTTFFRFINRAFLSHNMVIYLCVLFAVFAAIYLFKTKYGLRLRMVGENPAAADATGLSVMRIKYAYILLGGMICGLAGLYIPLISQKTWYANITGGRGWIVVALVIFVRWHPIKALLGSFIFGALSILGHTIQQYPELSSNMLFNQHIMGMYPYLLTILVLVFTYARKGTWRGPKAIGQAYFREER